MRVTGGPSTALSSASTTSALENKSHPGLVESGLRVRTDRIAIKIASKIAKKANYKYES